MRDHKRPSRQFIWLLGLAICALAAAVCGRGGETPASGGAPGSAQPDAPAASSVNPAAADMGGAVEEVTDNFGPGFTGRRLIDGRLDPTWLVSKNKKEIAFPQESVFSFYDREPVLIDAVTIVLPDKAAFAPKDIEIWTGMDSPIDRFTQVASATLEPKGGEQRVSFRPVEARFVKLRVATGFAKDGLEIAEVRIFEAARRGYVSLATRAPNLARWMGSPREAAQRGLDWLQHAAPTWAKQNNCYGCHVQGQVLMGQAVALKHKYRVNMRSLRALDDNTRALASYGGWFNSHSARVFAAMGLAYAAQALDITTDKGRVKAYPDYSELEESAKRLTEHQQADGSYPIDHPEPPIVQGTFMTTANSLVTLDWAATHFANDRFRKAVVRGTAYLASNQAETTLDKTSKIIALMRYGSADEKRSAWSVVEELAAEQQPDGGWKETASSVGSNAIATGQVLYAFKQAGVSIHSDMFQRGVSLLLKTQVRDSSENDGTWLATNTASKRPSHFAHTMWAVIGLAGAYGTDPVGGLRIVKQQADKPATRNLEIVLDVSGSMNAKLAGVTRWQTALDTLKQVVEALPDDMHVGLRVYGHRHPSSSAQTCTDTELVAPIARLDRARILSIASRLRPRGETPLIRSVLQTIGDLKTVGGGSVMLITDGEESCKGDAKAAAEQLKASGLNVTLNIVGFTITGQKVEAELTALAGSTGGRYYGAQDGAQLSRAVMLAALQRLPFDVLDQAGKVVVSGQTSELGHELPPGSYRLRIDALGQTLEEPVTIAAGVTTALTLAVEGDRFVIKRQ